MKRLNRPNQDRTEDAHVLEMCGATMRRSEQLQLQGVNLAVRPGQLHALIGPNGAGKSTALAVLAGDLVPERGEALLNGHAARTLTARSLAKLRAVRLQHAQFPALYSAADCVALARWPHDEPRARSADIANRALAAFDAASLGDRLARSLSGGEQARVLFAKAAAQVWVSEPDAPRYLLLDEPTAALDWGQHVRVMQALKNLMAVQNIGVLWVAHDLNLVAAVADHVSLLAAGRLQCSGTVAEVMTEPNLRAVYGQGLARVPTPGGGFALVHNVTHTVAHNVNYDAEQNGVKA